MWTTAAAAQSRNLAPFFNKHHALWRLLEFMKQRLGQLLLYGLYYKTGSFTACRIWNWDSTGRLIETFPKKNTENPWCLCTEALKTLDRPGCLLETLGEISKQEV